MSLAMSIITLFLFLVGTGLLYLSFRRNAVMWAVISTVIFTVNAVQGLGIPFSVTGAGDMIPTSMNYVLFGVNLIFAFFSLLYTIRQGWAILQLQQKANKLTTY